MENIYSDLENFEEYSNHEQLQRENTELKEKIKHLNDVIAQMQESILQEYNKLSKEHKTVMTNFSSMLKTAKAEIERKTKLIASANAEKDQLIFRHLNQGLCAGIFRNTKSIEYNKKGLENQTKKDCENRIQRKSQVDPKTDTTDENLDGLSKTSESRSEKFSKLNHPIQSVNIDTNRKHPLSEDERLDFNASGINIKTSQITKRSKSVCALRNRIGSPEKVSSRDFDDDKRGRDISTDSPERSIYNSSNLDKIKNTIGNHLDPEKTRTRESTSSHNSHEQVRSHSPKDEHKRSGRNTREREKYRNKSESKHDSKKRKRSPSREHRRLSRYDSWEHRRGHSRKRRWELGRVAISPPYYTQSRPRSWDQRSNECSKEFDRRQNLDFDRTFSTRHTNYERSNEYNKEFDRRQNLDFDRRSICHTNDERSNECNKEFDRRQNLDIDSKSTRHTNDERSNECKKEFDRRQNLEFARQSNRHINVERSSECNRKFNMRQNLDLDRQSNRHINVERSNECNKEFDSRQDLDFNNIDEPQYKRQKMSDNIDTYEVIDEFCDSDNEMEKHDEQLETHNNLEESAVEKLDKQQQLATLDELLTFKSFEVKAIRDINLEDPRLGSSKYLQSTDLNNITSICTTTARNITLKIVHYDVVFDKAKEMPTLLTMSPQHFTDDYVKEIYTDIEEQASNISVESGEIIEKSENIIRPYQVTSPNDYSIISPEMTCNENRFFVSLMGERIEEPRDTKNNSSAEAVPTFVKNSDQSSSITEKITELFGENSLITPEDLDLLPQQSDGCEKSVTEFDEPVGTEEDGNKRFQNSNIKSVLDHWNPKSINEDKETKSNNSKHHENKNDKTCTKLAEKNAVANKSRNKDKTDEKRKSQKRKKRNKEMESLNVNKKCHKEIISISQIGKGIIDSDSCTSFKDQIREDGKTKIQSHINETHRKNLCSIPFDQQNDLHNELNSTLVQEITVSALATSAPFKEIEIPGSNLLLEPIVADNHESDKAPVEHLNQIYTKSADINATANKSTNKDKTDDKRKPHKRKKRNKEIESFDVNRKCHKEIISMPLIDKDIIASDACSSFNDQVREEGRTKIQSHINETHSKNNDLHIGSNPFDLQNDLQTELNSALVHEIAVSALATSTPYKETERIPESNSLLEPISADNHESDKTPVEQIDETVVSDNTEMNKSTIHENDQPDIRIFVRRRRRPIMKRTHRNRRTPQIEVASATFCMEAIENTMLSVYQSDQADDWLKFMNSET